MPSPQRGDLVYLNFDPQAGHEQSGRRPGIVLSPKSFNEVTGFVSICPITSTQRGWGFEVPLPEGLVFQGVILTDQLKNLDWSVRTLQVMGRAPQSLVQICLDRIHIYL